MYHLYLRPGIETMRSFGDYRFMSWNGGYFDRFRRLPGVFAVASAQVDRRGCGIRFAYRRVQTSAHA